MQKHISIAFFIIPAVTYIPISIIVIVAVTMPTLQLTVIKIISYSFLFLNAQNQKIKERNHSTHTVFVPL